MKTLAFSLLLFALAALAGCMGDTPAERHDKIAAGFCECTAPLIALNKEAASLTNDTMDRAAQVFQQLQSEYLKAKECSAAITAQYGKLKPEELDAVQKALAEKCPEMTEQSDLLREMLGE